MSNEELEEVFESAGHYVQLKYGDYPEGGSPLSDEERKLRLDAAIIFKQVC